MRYFDVRRPRPMSDTGESRDENNSRGMKDSLMPAVRPSLLLKISIRDLISANEKKDSLAQPY